jgi:hypothetical protein
MAPPKERSTRRQKGRNLSTFRPGLDFDSLA